MAQRQRLIAGGVSKGLPGAPLERLAPDLRDHLEGGGNPGDKAKLCQMDGVVVTGEVGIGDELACSGRVLAGPQQRLSPRREHLGV